MSSKTGAIAVYCGSSMGNQKAFCNAAESLGRALVTNGRPLVYGGGSKGIMGVVSGAVLEHGGEVTGIVPYAMVAAGGEGEKIASSIMVELNEKGREKAKTIVVDSMHERKVEMAKLSDAFIGLPGGFGTFEEVFEVTTWTQIGIHRKAVVLVNVLGFWDPVRQLIKSSVNHGFIRPGSEGIIIFVDGPADHSKHENFDWGSATLEAVDNWKFDSPAMPFDWTKRMDGTTDEKIAAA